MITIKSTGDFKNTTKFLDKITKGNYIDNILNKYGQEGVDALAEATPKRTGLTASSWDYEIERDANGATIHWFNTNVIKDYYNVALYIQLGHGTKNGGYVQGIDYINPAMKPIFDELADKCWKEVTSA